MVNNKFLLIMAQQNLNDLPLTNLSQPLAASAANHFPDLEHKGTAVDNLSCEDFAQIPQCHLGSMRELHGGAPAA